MALVKSIQPDGVLVLKISRPEALNALNTSVLNALMDLIQEAQESPEIKGIIITGEGEKAFVAGADIKELAALDKGQAFELSKKGQRIFSAIQHCSTPVLAAVNGFALGGGCELAMACHMRIATENAKFSQPEVNLGIIPGYGGTQRLTQIVGRGKALELMMTGDMVTAEEAKSLGLVNHVVADQHALMELALQIMRKIVNKAPVAIAQVIKSVNAGYAFEKAGYEAEANAFAECVTTQDFVEGTTAFIEKRKPVFKGK
ncbi:MAG TPA: enoyl-CoA hydratase-related protein [Ohtaekwangia sp.]|nr:enoyl-CoA hydratase-related protein [Ohtaekwangia sp.]